MNNKKYKFKAKLFSINTIAHLTNEFTFKIDEPFLFEPGQYIWLILPNMLLRDPHGDRRALSIVSSDKEKNLISVACRFSETPFKQSLYSLKTGDNVKIEGPFGSSFVLEKEEKKNLVMIAGGTGIAPFIPVIENLKDKKINCQLVLVNSAKERIVYLDKLKKFKKNLKNFDFVSVMGDFSWEKILSPPLSNDSKWMISGNEEFCDKVYKILDQEGIPKLDMRFEQNYPRNSNSLTIEQFSKSETNKHPILKILVGALSNSTNHIVITDNNGKIVFANKSAQEITGYEFSEMIENTPRLWGGLMGKEFYESFWKRKMNGEEFTGEITNRRKSGDIYYSIAHVSPITDEKKNIVGHLATEQDITDIKNIQERLRESEERWNFALEGSRDGVWDWNVQDNIVFFSKRWKEIIGFDDNEIKNDLSEWSKRTHPDDLKIAEKELEKHFKKLTPYYESEQRIKAKNGKYKWILARGKVVSWNAKGKPLRMVGTHTDITDRKDLEEKLKELSLVAQNTSNLVVVTDGDGLITWVNEAFVRITGYNLNEAEGRKPGDILQGKDTNPKTIVAIRKGLKTKKPFSAEILNYSKEGREYWLDLNISPIFNENGEVEKFIAIQRDVTEKKQRELQLKNLSDRLLLAKDAADLGVWELDVNSQKRFWDAKMYRLYGVECEDENLNKMRLVEDIRKETIEAEEFEKIEKLISELMAGKIQKLEEVIKIKWKNGEIHYLKILGILQKNSLEKVNKIIGVTFDVTKDFLVDKSKTEFVSLASHQLRTPLTNIKWKLDMMMDGDFGEFSKDQISHLQELAISNKSMIDMVNTLLNISRIELGVLALEPEKMDLKKVSTEIIDGFEMMSKKSGIKIVRNVNKCPKSFFVDPVIYKIVLENLVSNAIKYSKIKGKVAVSVEEVNKNCLIEKMSVPAGSVLITVQDSGIGIPKNQLTKVFSKLFRATNTNSVKAGGNGLGLYLVKEMVRQFNGEIWLKSSLGKGTTFYVFIPKNGMKKMEGAKLLSK